MSRGPGEGGPLYRRTILPRVPPCATPARGRTGLRVLLVEDVPAARAFLRERLVARDVEVVGPAADGAQAAALVRMSRPDVCVVDVAGGTGTGLLALREVVAADPTLEVVACAGTGTGRVAAEAVRCGARRVVTTLRELEEVLAARGAANPSAAQGPSPAASDAGWVGFGGIAERCPAGRRPAAADEAAALRRLRRAIDGDGFVAFAQPVVDLATGGAGGHVLSAGLTGPDGTVREEGAFLPLARRFGLTVEVDRWTVREATRYAARGHAIQVDVTDESVADPSFADAVEAALRDAQAPASRLTLSVRESALVDGPKPARTLIRRLRAGGCAVVLREFTGRSGDPCRVPVDGVAFGALAGGGPSGPPTPGRRPAGRRAGPGGPGGST